MAGLLDFDSKQLDALLDEFGIRQAWVNMMATHIFGVRRFTYILEDDEFNGYSILEKDLLLDLTIGEISVLYEYCVARQDSDSRKLNGQYFTPDDVAKFMVKRALTFPSGLWLDPCSGIGNLSWHLVSAQDSPEQFLRTNLLLVDKDSLALLIARFLFAVHFQNKRRRLFHEIASKFISFDFLSVSQSDSDTLFPEKGLDQIPVHDYVIVNPPYFATKEQDWRFETSEASDLYAYFLENVIKTSKGFVSITPQSFTNAKKFKTLRKLIISNFSDLAIYNFDNIPGNIFHGVKFGSKNSNTSNSMRAAIMVARPGKSTPRITSLMRWKTSERMGMLDTIDEFLGSPELTEEYFPKVSKVFESLYIEVSKASTLEGMLSRKPTSFALHIPSAPRYFISALKTPVSRVSQRTIFFYNQTDLDTAYLLLNSSVMYWWWRVRDGGMTLSLETLRSLPMVDFQVDARLVELLGKSELENRVYKLNAGTVQENVKHPKDLIAKLNMLILPKYKNQLLATHENSELLQIEFLQSNNRL